MEIALNLNLPSFFSVIIHFYEEIIITSNNVFLDYIQTSYHHVLIQKLQWSSLEFLKSVKNSVSPIVKMFQCQAVKKDSDIKDFIE